MENLVDWVHDAWTGWRSLGPWWSQVVVEGGKPDEAVPEGCSLEHERWRRGGVIVKKTGGGLKSPQG
jgi:hypothetical protein